MYKLATMENPPLRCGKYPSFGSSVGLPVIMIIMPVLGSDAYKAMETKLATYTENVKKFKDLSNSTDVESQGQKL